MAEYSVSNATPGSTTIGYRLRIAGVTGARVTAGIVETPVNSGVFVASISATPPFTIIWDDNSAVFASDDILSSGGGGSDPLLNPVPNGYAAGTAGYVLGNLAGSAVVVVSPISGSAITVYRGTTWSITMTVGDITGFSKLWFTVKNNTSDPDSAALVQIEETAGLLVLNGSSSVTASDGSIAVNNPTTGSITITLKASSASQIAPVTDINYDVKALVGGTVTMMADGRTRFSVLADVTRHIS